MESCKPQNDFTYIDVDAINNKNNVIEKPKQKALEKAPSRASRKLHKGDILFSMVRPYLKNIAMVTAQYENAIASTGFYVVTSNGSYNSRFLFFLLTSTYVVDGLNQYIKGDNSPSINNCHIENFLYPLPPIKEQCRIVAEIDRLFALIDIIEEGKASLEDAIKQAKRKVLELAVNGKLSDDNRHYEKYAQTTILGNLCKLVDGSKITDKEMPYLDVKYLRGKSEAQFFNEGQFVPKGTNIILVDGENSGEVFTAPADGYKGSTFKLLNIDSSVYPEFILLFIQTNQLKLKESKVGSAIPHLNKKLFKSLEIPLTSYEEQEEIVDKAKTLVSFLDKILINLV